MKYIVIGNAISLIGSLIMTFMGLIKNRRRFLIAQSVMNCFYMTAFLFLGGIAGAIVNVVTLIRNIVCLKCDFTKTIKVIFIVLQIGLSVYFGTTDFISWMPIIAGCIFTWVMDSDNMIMLKSVIIFTQILWLIYDFVYLNYATVPFDIAACVTNGIALISLIKNAKIKTEKE